MDKFLIGPFTKGLNRDIVPFLLPEDAFTRLTNMRIYQNRIIRKPAFTLLNDADPYGLKSRLKVLIGTTDAVTGNFPINPIVVGAVGAIGQQFSVGNAIFTVTQVNGAMDVTNGGGATGTFNTVTTGLSIIGATPNTSVYWYPCTPVRGFAYYEENEQEYAFDNQWAYGYTPEGWVALTPLADARWNSGIYDRFISTSYRGDFTSEATLFVANGTDPVKYYNNTVVDFTNFQPNTINPATSANYHVVSAKIVKRFENRLFLLNTVEDEGVTNNVAHSNRIRWSAAGDALNADAWYQPPGRQNRGSFADLSKGERITACEELNGRLVVFTENHIYEIIPTGNANSPFDIQEVSGSVGTFTSSVVQVNNSIIFVSPYGIHMYDGKNTIRIDDDLSNAFDNGIISFYNSSIWHHKTFNTVYISYSPAFGNEVQTAMLAYNYKNNTWSLFESVCTNFGDLFHNPAGVRYFSKSIIAGNQVGYVREFNSSVYKNGISQNIIRMNNFDAAHVDLTLYNHNLADGDVIRIENCDIAGINGGYLVEIIDVNTIRIESVINVAAYHGDAAILRVDRIDIRTKEFNPYLSKGYGVSLSKITFNVDRNDNNSSYSVIAFPNGSAVENDTLVSYPGSRLLETQAYDLINTVEATQVRIWHDVFLPSKSESISIGISMDNELIVDDAIPFQSLSINAMVLHTEPTMEF